MIKQELHSAPDEFLLWSPGGNQLFQGNFQTSELIKLLLTSVLSGKGKCTKRISHLVHSFMQDLTYNSSMGRKTKKHVELGLS